MFLCFSFCLILFLVSSCLCYICLSKFVSFRLLFLVSSCLISFCYNLLILKSCFLILMVLFATLFFVWLDFFWCFLYFYQLQVENMKQGGGDNLIRWKKEGNSIWKITYFLLGTQRVHSPCFHQPNLLYPHLLGLWNPTKHPIFIVFSIPHELPKP